jgi:hypothetical protein
MATGFDSPIVRATSLKLYVLAGRFTVLLVRELDGVIGEQRELFFLTGFFSN